MVAALYEGRRQIHCAWVTETLTTTSIFGWITCTIWRAGDEARRFFCTLNSHQYHIYKA